MFLIPVPQKYGFSTSETHTVKDMYKVLFCQKVKSNITEYFKTFFKYEECEKDSDVVIEHMVGLKDEEYTLKIDSETIHIGYSDDEALFRALSTLKQILLQQKDGVICCLDIADYPDIKKRGLMLDVSRGRIPTMDELKRIIDILADLKYNMLQLYFDSFVFEYKSFEKYTNGRDVITIAQVKELEEYCSERFIDLMANQNGFGHMAAWLKTEEYEHLKITRDDEKQSNTVNPLHEETLPLIEKIYGDVLPHFKSKFVNIGFDEPFELGLGETKEACEKDGIGKVFVDYLKQVSSMVENKFEKKVMFWNDYADKFPEAYADIPKNLIPVEWGYETEHKFDRNCQLLKEHGFEFYVAPGTSTWCSFTGRTNTMIFNIHRAAEAAKYYGASGFLLTEWEAGSSPYFPVLAYLPYAFGASYSWNAGDRDVEKAYGERLQVVEWVKRYVDYVILNCRDGKSVSDIAYRLGNYYLLEDYSALHFNGTYLWRCVFNKSAKLGVDDFYRFKDVAGYLGNIEAELLNYDCTSASAETALVIEELLLLCRITKAASLRAATKAAEANEIEYICDSIDIEALMTEYVKCYRLTGRETDIEKFPNKFKEAMLDF